MVNKDDYSLHSPLRLGLGVFGASFGAISHPAPDDATVERSRRAD